MFRPGIVGMRGSTVIRLRPCMSIEYTPPRPVLDALPGSYKTNRAVGCLATLIIVSHQLVVSRTDSWSIPGGTDSLTFGVSTLEGNMALCGVFFFFFGRRPAPVVSRGGGRGGGLILAKACEFYRSTALQLIFVFLCILQRREEENLKLTTLPRIFVRVEYQLNSIQRSRQKRCQQPEGKKFRARSFLTGEYFQGWNLY